VKPLASTTRSPRRIAAAGVVAATLTVGAAGAAYALAHDPHREGALAPAAPEQADASQAPVALADAPAPTTSPLTQEQSDAFWAAGYYMDDADALAELWGTDLLEAKSRAGQLLLDGRPVPVAPGSALDLTDPGTIGMLEMNAFWDAGYTAEDGATLAALWHVDVGEAKSSAGKILREGQALPIPPSGTPVD